MRILLLNCVYKEGSTGKIVFALSEELRAMGHDVLTCYGLGKEYYDNYSIKVCSSFEHKVNALFKRITGISHGGLYLSNLRIKKIVERFNPDVVHVHIANPSIYNLFELLYYLSDSKIKTVITIHAETAHTAGCEHSFDCNKWIEGCHNCEEYRQKIGSWFFDSSKLSYKKMKNAINSFDVNQLTITAVSPWLARRAKLSGIMRNFDVVYVPNGVDTSLFKYKKKVRCLVNRNSYRLLFLFVTPYLNFSELDNKGGFFLPSLASSHPDCKFVIVASRNVGKVREMPENIQVWGQAKSQEELSSLYSESDYTLLLSRRETFSMVTAESLCCGTPVVGFKAGGPESIALKEYCFFVDYGDFSELHRLLNDLSSDYDKQIVSQKGNNAYATQVMAHHYYQVYIGQRN